LNHRIHHYRWIQTGRILGWYDDCCLEHPDRVIPLTGNPPNLDGTGYYCRSGGRAHGSHYQIVGSEVNIFHCPTYQLLTINFICLILTSKLGTNINVFMHKRVDAWN
jgi:hypothetical protein